jgi:outer membrane immunogenic protein
MKNIKPLLVTTALLSTFASTTFAAPMDNTNRTTTSGASTTRENIARSPFTGPYIGGYGGYDWTDADTPIPGFKPESRGWDYGVFAGIRIDGLLDRMNGMGIGLNGAIEGFYGWSDSDDEIGGIAVNKKNEWGVSFRPGLSFLNNDKMGISPYGILGYRNTEFEAFAGTAGASERYNGFDLGIGTQLLAMGQFGVRAEYTHTWYASEGDIDPDSDTVRLGVSYQF